MAAEWHCLAWVQTLKQLSFTKCSCEGSMLLEMHPSFFVLGCFFYVYYKASLPGLKTKLNDEKQYPNFLQWSSLCLSGLQLSKAVLHPSTSSEFESPWNHSYPVWFHISHVTEINFVMQLLIAIPGMHTMHRRFTISSDVLCEIYVAASSTYSLVTNIRQTRMPCLVCAMYRPQGNSTQGHQKKNGIKPTHWHGESFDTCKAIFSQCHGKAHSFRHTFHTDPKLSYPTSIGMLPAWWEEVGQESMKTWEVPEGPGYLALIRKRC